MLHLHTPRLPNYPCTSTHFGGVSLSQAQDSLVATQFFSGKFAYFYHFVHLSVKLRILSLNGLSVLSESHDVFSDAHFGYLAVVLELDLLQIDLAIHCVN